MREMAPLLLALMWLSFGCVTLSSVVASSFKSGVKEYCQGKFFNASCPVGHVILMEHASYGRMSSKGRCITGSHGKTGCVQDVLQFMHSRCSAKRTCGVYIAEQELHRLNPCSIDLTSYLEAEYSCIKVANHDSFGGKCRMDHRKVLRASSDPEFVSMDSGNCLWVLRAKEGQTIQISLLSFGGNAPITSEDNCEKVGYIREDHRQSSQLCVPISSHTSSSQGRVVYMSSRNTITLDMIDPQVLHHATPFLIKFQALGCPTPKAPHGGWISVDGNNAVVHCNQTHDTWYLTCTGTDWQGEAGNCSENAENSWTQTSSNYDSHKEFPYKILIVVAIGVALGVFIGGLLLSLAAVYMKRKHRSRSQPPEILSSMEVAYATQLRPSHMEYPMIYKDSSCSAGDYPTFSEASQTVACPKHDVIYDRRCSQSAPFNGTTKSLRFYESPHHAM